MGEQEEGDYRRLLRLAYALGGAGTLAGSGKVFRQELLLRSLLGNESRANELVDEEAVAYQKRSGKCPFCGTADCRLEVEYLL